MSKTIFDDTPPLGTIVTAAFLNAIQNHRHNGLDEDGSCPLDYAITTGSANAYLLNLTPALTSYVIGMPIFFKASFTSSGPATLNINNIGAKAMKKNFNQDIEADDIQNGQIVMAIYDGTNFQVFLPHNNFFYSTDSGSADAYAVTYSPALTAHVIGLPLRFKAANTNTGASTLAVNGLTAVAIKRLNGSDLQAGDIPAGGMITVAYDGTYYQLQSVIPVPLAGSIVQVQSYKRSDKINGTGSIPNDDTIPQINEGDQILSLTFTPKYSNSVLDIEVVVNAAVNDGNGSITIALFKNSNTNAIASCFNVQAIGGALQQVRIGLPNYVAETTSPISFTVRIGGSATYTLNGSKGGSLYGGTLFSYIKITEIKT